MSKTYDASIKHPSTVIIAGGTGSGKTYFTNDFLKHKNLMQPIHPKKVIYIYKEWQPIFDKMKKEKTVDQFIQGMPEENDLKEIMKKHKDKGGCILVFDDMISEIGKQMIACFTVYSHHLNCTVVLLIQSLFLENKAYQICSLNAHYIVLMKNRRDGASVSYLARQISPYNGKFITEAYLDATKKPYSYLLFDMRQETEDILRLRSNIFDFPISIYVKDNQ